MMRRFLLVNHRQLKQAAPSAGFLMGTKKIMQLFLQFGIFLLGFLVWCHPVHAQQLNDLWLASFRDCGGFPCVQAIGAAPSSTTWTHGNILNDLLTRSFQKQGDGRSITIAGVANYLTPLPFGTSAQTPTTCLPNVQFYVKTDATPAGQQVFLCNSTGTGFNLVGGGGGTFANPSALVGLTAINGSASTAMRSDAAPALSQAIVPTWTGLHTYAPALATGNIIIGASVSSAPFQIYTPYTSPLATGLMTVYQSNSATIIMADFIFDNENVTVTTDSTAVRHVVRQRGASAGYPNSTAPASLRAGEFQMVKSSTAPTGGSGWGIEIGVHSQITPTAGAFNAGIYIGSSHTGWIPSGLRNDYGIIITGEDGWKHGLLFVDTDGTTLYDLDQNGRVSLFTHDTGFTMTGNRGQIFIQNSGTTGAGIEFNATGAGGKGWSLVATANAFPTSGGKFVVYDVASNTTPFQIISSGSANAALVVNAGVQLGGPAGGDKGVGTLNAAADIYKNGTAYTNPDYVLEYAAEGKIVQYLDKEGAEQYSGLKPLKETMSFAREHYVLPRVWEARQRHGTLGLFTGGDAVLASLEEAYLYIEQLEKRISRLEVR